MINVGRARAAHDLAIATALRMDVDILIIVESNMRMTEKNQEIKDSSCDIAVLRMNKRSECMENGIGKLVR